MIASALRAGRSIASRLLSSRVDTAKPLPSTKSNFAYSTAQDGTVVLVDMTPPQEDDSTGIVPLLDVIWICVAHVLALAIGLYAGIKVAATYGAITDPVMTNYQVHTVFMVIAFTLLGIYLGIIALSADTVRRVAYGMFSLAITGFGGAFLWIVWAHPQLPQITHDLGLVVDVLAGTPVQP